MQPEEPFDVPFCDLCNTSVPLQDLEAGTAVRHGDKTIGACCLGQLRRDGGAADASAATAGSRVDRVDHAVHQDSRLLPLSIAMLAAVAAATIFLDYRMAAGEKRWTADAEQFDGRLEAQSTLLTSVSAELDGVVRRADVDSLGAGLHAIKSSVAEVGDRVQGTSEELNKTVAALDGRVREIESRRPDYGPVLTELRQQLQRQAVTLAELLAKPVAQAVPAMVDPEPVAVVPGLPPDLAHQVRKLEEADPAARFEAVDELLRSKDGAVLEHLLPMLKDEDLFVRRLTVEGLRGFRQSEVVDALLVSLADPEDIVRDTAWRSLKELTGQKIPFEAAGSREARARGQRRWRDWWDKNRASFGI